MSHKAGDFYAQINCPDCKGNGRRWLAECGRCGGYGTLIVRCVRCSCHALIGALDPEDSPEVFKTTGVDLPARLGRECPVCDRLPYAPSIKRGHLRLNPPAERGVSH